MGRKKRRRFTMFGIGLISLACLGGGIIVMAHGDLFYTPAKGKGLGLGFAPILSLVGIIGLIATIKGFFADEKKDI